MQAQLAARRPESPAGFLMPGHLGSARSGEDVARSPAAILGHTLAGAAMTPAEAARVISACAALGALLGMIVQTIRGSSDG
jgi:hypothetical protein